MRDITNSNRTVKNLCSSYLYYASVRLPITLKLKLRVNVPIN